jgi:hypothetical protein
MASSAVTQKMVMAWLSLASGANGNGPQYAPTGGTRQEIRKLGIESVKQSVGIGEEEGSAMHAPIRTSGAFR